jgi:hypothetical protein
MTEPRRSPFQYSLRTLLLLFVVAASSLAVFGAWGILVFALSVGLAVYLRDAESLWPLMYLALVVLCLMCVLSLVPVAINASREAGHRASCLNKMRQLGLALRNYYNANGHFPPAYTVGKDGKPLESWRVLILPYLEYDYLYKSLDHSQPWDAPKNKGQLAFQLREFACPADPSTYTQGTLQTNYFAVVGPDTAWDESRYFANSGEEASHTIMLVEVAGSGVPWAEPKDISIESIGSPDSTPPALVPSSRHGDRHKDFFFVYDPVNRFVATMADGSGRVIDAGHLSPEQLRRIFEIGGCTDEALAASDSYARHHLNWPNIAALAVWLVSVGTLLTAAVRGRKERFAPPPVDEAAAPRV